MVEFEETTTQVKVGAPVKRSTMGMTLTVLPVTTLISANPLMRAPNISVVANSYIR